MAAAKLEVRAGEVLLAAIDAAAQRNGVTRSAEVLATLAERYLGHEAEPPRAKAAPTRKAPVAADPRQALAQAEARAGVRPAHLDTSMVPVHDGGKRPAYQKGSGAKPKR